jgi:hypothetical protein
MARILLQYLLPLLLPFLAYFVYVALARGNTPDWLEGVPWPHLAGAGVLLMAISLIAWSLTTGAPTEEIYLPPRFEDGRIVPGRTVGP